MTKATEVCVCDIEHGCACEPDALPADTLQAMSVAKMRGDSNEIERLRADGLARIASAKGKHAHRADTTDREALLSQLAELGVPRDRVTGNGRPIAERDALYLAERVRVATENRGKRSDETDLPPSSARAEYVNRQQNSWKAGSK
ncbi:MAG: hypothetical protein JWP01_3372 [Myxococcales bacterium]|nr:hypothetical protein [Myxococcales bacterium]